MTWSSVPDKANGDVFTEVMWDAYIRDNLNTGPPVLLANSTLGGTAASVDFTSISQAFSTIFAIGYVRGDTAALGVNVSLRLNGDSGSNYDIQNLSGSAATASAAELFAQTSMNPAVMPGSTAGANLFGVFIVYIPFYSGSSNNKAVITGYGSKAGTSTTNITTAAKCMHWRSNAAVNQVTFLAGSGNFVSGSRFSIYGQP